MYSTTTILIAILAGLLMLLYEFRREIFYKKAKAKATENNKETVSNLENEIPDELLTYEEKKEKYISVELPKEVLIKHISLAIDPKFQNWVLFHHGTCIVIEDAEEALLIEQKALEKIKEYGQVIKGSQAGDFGVVELQQTEGWLVYGHEHGIYTYIHPLETGDIETLHFKEYLADLIVGTYGRTKRDLDSQLLKIIAMNVKGIIQEK